LDIRKDTAVVVYDTQGVFSAPRVWWTFKAFGHDRRAAQRCSSESRVPSRWSLVAGRWSLVAAATRWWHSIEHIRLRSSLPNRDDMFELHRVNCGF